MSRAPRGKHRSKRGEPARDPLGRDLLASDEGGAAYVEFLLSFIPVFVMFLGMVQMGLMFVAGLAVQRAASTAARAAMVVLDDDPRHYGGEPRMQIGGGSGASGPGAEGGLGGILGGGGGGGISTGLPAIDAAGSARLSAIRSAASIPLYAVAPTPAALSRPEAIMHAIGDSSSAMGMPPSRAATAMLYNRGALAVRLVDAPRSQTDTARFESAPLHADGAVPTPARVRVTYLFHCAVPLANRLICHDPLALLFGPDGAATIRGLRGPMSAERIAELARERDAEAARQDAASIGWDDLGPSSRTIVGAIGVGTELAGLPSFRVKVMSAEAQLPIHYANYAYQGE